VVRSVAPPYGEVVVVVDEVVVDVTAGAVVAVVSVGNVVVVVVVVSSPLDPHAARTNANTTTMARPRRSLIGFPLSPMPLLSAPRVHVAIPAMHIESVATARIRPDISVLIGCSARGRWPLL
jgi:hypothetical protein